MSLPPGLLPESDEPSRSRTSRVLGGVVAVSLLAIAALLYRNQQLLLERNDALKMLAAQRQKVVDMPVPGPAEPEKPTPTPAAPAPDPVPAVVAASSRAPKVRV